MKSKKSKLWTIFSVCLSILVLSVGIAFGCIDFSPQEEQIVPPSIGATGPTNASGYWTDSGRYSSAWSGAGTQFNPYLIQTAQDLARLSYMIYSGRAPITNTHYCYSGVYFKQTADIDLSQYYWQPIGVEYNRSGTQIERSFSGGYDGGGHTISGVFTPPGSSNAYSYQGLFGRVSGYPTANFISNVRIEDSYIQGYGYLGGIVGSVSQSEIKNCQTSANVSGSGSFIGGVAGWTYKTIITNCYNLGYVSGYSYVGGFAGSAGSDTAFTKCYFGGNCTLSKGVYSGTDTTSRISMTQLDYNGGVNPTKEGNLLGVIENKGSSSNLIFNDDCSYYINNQNIYINSVNTSDNNTCFMTSIKANLTAGKSYTLSFQAVSRNSSVLNSHVDGGMFLNADYKTFYHDDSGPIVNSTITPVKLEHTFTPEVTGIYYLRIDTTLNNASFRIFDLKLVENIRELNSLSTYVGTSGSEIDLPNPQRSGYTFKGWQVSDGGSLKSGYSSSGNFTPSIRQDTDGTKFTRFHGEWDKPSSGVWYSQNYPNYSFTPGHEYRIDYDYRINTLQGGVALDFRHARVDNDYLAPCGNVQRSTTNGWVHYTATQTLYATSDRGGVVDTDPLFEIYTGDLSTSTTSKVIFDFDIKNIVITDDTGGCVAWSSNIYAFGSSDSTLTAVWEGMKYTVTLDKQSGDGGTSSVSVIYGSPLSSISIPSRDNYNFNGYYTGRNGTGTKYYNSEGRYTRIYDLNSDTTLYAYWTLKTFTVTLDNQGGIGGLSSVTATINSSMPTLSSLPTKQGYKFAGYYSGQNGSGTKYYNADGSSAKTYTLEESIILYAYWELKTWVDYVTVTSFGGGNGDIESPYIISSPQHLALLAKNVNSGNTYEGKYFKQTANLNMEQYPWLPIGMGSNKFSGNYFGNNMKILGLNNESNLELLGLFGYIDNGAEISNVKIQEATFISTDTSSYVGGIVGDMGRISYANCNLSNCSFDGILSGTYTGGIAGNMGGKCEISNCLFTGEATGTTAVGGLVGWLASGSDSTIKSSINEGNLEGIENCAVGGIVGQGNLSNIINCISNGNLEADKGYIGGIVGYLSVYYTCMVANCAGYGTINTNETTKAAGLFGYISGTNQLTINNCSFYGRSNDKINWVLTNSYSKSTFNSCYTSINGEGAYTAGNFNDFTIAGDFKDGLPIQNALYAVGIWQGKGDEIIKYFVDNNFTLIN